MPGDVLEVTTWWRWGTAPDNQGIETKMLLTSYRTALNSAPPPRTHTVLHSMPLIPVSYSDVLLAQSPFACLGLLLHPSSKCNPSTFAPILLVLTRLSVSYTRKSSCLLLYAQAPLSFLACLSCPCLAIISFSNPVLRVQHSEQVSWHIHCAPSHLLHSCCFLSETFHSLDCSQLPQ